MIIQKQIQAVTIIPRPFSEDRKKNLVPKNGLWIFLNIVLVVLNGRNMEIDVW